MLTNAMRICEAKFGHLLLYDGESFHPAHLGDVPAAYREIWERGPLRRIQNLRLVNSPKPSKFFEIPDIKADPAYAEGEPLRVATVEIAGAHDVTWCSNAQGKPARWCHNHLSPGSPAIHRQADRAGAELRCAGCHRHREHAAAQRTAAIAPATDRNRRRVTSYFKLAWRIGSVFEAILANATRICEATFGTLAQIVDGIPRLMFRHGVPAALQDIGVARPQTQPTDAISRLVTTGQAVHVTDLQDAKLILRATLSRLLVSSLVAFGHC